MRVHLRTEFRVPLKLHAVDLFGVSLTDFQSEDKKLYKSGPENASGKSVMRVTLSHKLWELKYHWAYCPF